MTYLVLARKWRPRSFETLVGQDHVVRALTHALDSQRLHHAWLFTGTRGVGKTTLSRILAKSLNCETGITSRPCGQCRACTEIDSGRFVDYLELDAASNRGVDEMTQLLEQAVYAPGAGRFKVYMIDEVHMLTGHAFNAMLKTLEEPPPHVKFILATTDPQKIPVTVLSRCLQFNLKQMPPDSIVGHLRAVLGQESMDFEIPALRLIAQAAGGSMRDALSLTDQAIAYSASNLTEDAVRAMLGTIDQRHLVRLLDALATGNAIEVLAVADELAMRGLSYAGALADLAVLLSRIAIEHRVTGVTADDDPLAQDIARLAQTMHPDAVQLFYSVAVHSRSELSLAPDEYAGFVMACLRMLALNAGSGPLTVQQAPARPKTDSSAASSALGSAPIEAAVAKPAPTPTRPEASVAPPTLVAVPASAPVQAEPAATMVAATSEADTQPSVASRSPADIAPWESLPSSTTQEARPVSIDKPGVPSHASASTPSVADDVEKTSDVALAATDSEPIAAHDDADAPPPWVDEEIPFEADSAPMQDSGFMSDPDDDFETLASAPSSAPVPVTPVLKQAVASKRKHSPALADVCASTWPALAAQLPVTGLAAELARQSEWIGVQGDAVMLKVAVRTLAESESRVRLQTVLCEHFGLGLRLEIAVGATGDATAHAVAQTEKAARQQAAEDSVATDPFVQALVADFGGQVISGTVRHLDTPSA